MKRSLFALPLVGAAIAVAACGGGGSTDTGHKASAATAPASGTVRVGTTKLGRILVDSQGRSLYLFEKDKGTASTCYGACASFWPPLTVSSSPKAGAGVVAAKLGTTKRKDGMAEVTYNGHPLYRFAPDKAPGQIGGEGLEQFGGGWDVVAPSGNKIEGGEG